ncbi:MAG: TIGR04002 family protein [Ruminococcus sp.]
MKTNKNLFNLVLAALFAALIFVLTYFIKFPTAIGYIHPGDAAIYLAAALLPTPYALAAAGLGGALADLVGGYFVYIPVTFAVKVLLALCFTSKKENMINIRNIIATVVCCGITVFGYFSFEIFYYGTGAFGSMPLNLLQGVVSGVLFVVIGFAFDKAKIKNRLVALN